MRVQIAIARDRLRNPTVLILDEALSSLDVAMRHQVSDAIREWRRGKTTIIITHDISEIGDTDFAYVMEAGSVVQEGYRKDLETRTGAFQTFVAASGSSSRRQTKDRLLPLSDIPEFNLDSNSETLISPHPLREPHPLSCGQKGLCGEGIRAVHDLPPIPGRRHSNIATPGKTSPVPNHFLSSPRRGSFTSSPGGERYDSASAEDAGDSLISEKREMIPKPTPSRSLSLIYILRTVWPSLCLKHKVFLVLGFAAALFHATSTPVFSYALARLLGSILDTRIPESEARRWSLSIIAIAIVDAGNCYLMYYLLEACGQEWVDHHRIQSFARVLDQPRAWFFDDRNSVPRLIGDLEKHAEEMRSLVARFAGYGFVGMSLTVIGTSWSFACSWRLTLIGLCVVPIMYGVSRAMGRASDKYESQINHAAQFTGSVLHEAIASIETVRNYSLERYFRQKYFGATNSALKTGIRRSLYTGVWVGLAESAILFATGGPFP